ncbi:phosphatase PAP2 family protein [Streptomyces sp. NPDC006530]|uniref:phosphatase PAP2 family protein n=1 Tax=Streptomyces sp. NPDC006530 TaxID=3364750 RepID=UPI0036C75CBE
MTGRSRPVGAILPAPLRAWLAIVTVLAAVVVVLLGVLYSGHDSPGGLDLWARSLADDVSPSWRQVALALDSLGEPTGSAVLVAGALAGCLLVRSSRAAVFIVVGVGATVGAATLGKHLVGRTIHGGNLSYPSGHTAFLTALALMAALLAAGRIGLGRAAGTLLVGGVTLVAGAAMGWAQVALGAHYPTDVLGGWCTALVVVPVAGLLVDRMVKWRVNTGP